MDDFEKKLRELHRQRQAVLDQLQRSRVDLDRIDFAIRFLEDTSGDASVIEHRPQTLVETSKGSIRGIRTRIMELLEMRGHVMTAGEMATELYDPTLRMTPEQLRRRLSVQTSAMFRATDPPELLDSGRKNKKREIYWGLPKWFGADGKIDLTRMPDEIL
ncbi:MAG: hypothetical protein H6590_01660 [Flavobacteriales bacterium]|nr:hypothetical protein [Flavobacteriales bacterium]MCB9178120.1 hypothetical protein [Flavobacteriales bacterium]